MGKQLLYIPQPNKETLLRFEEIRFYLLTKALNGNNGYISNETVNILEILADKFKISQTVISVSAIEIEQPANRPIQLEIIAMLAQRGASIRNIQKLARIGPNRYYILMNQYISENRQLRPRFKDERHKELKRFTDKVVELLRIPLEVIK